VFLSLVKWSCMGRISPSYRGKYKCLVSLVLPYPRLTYFAITSSLRSLQSAHICRRVWRAHRRHLVRKVVFSMSASVHPSPPLREIHGFIRSCETILSCSVLRGNTPLSSYEQKIVQYYSEELKAYLCASQTH
jgi:hypothetical protein